MAALSNGLGGLTLGGERHSQGNNGRCTARVRSNQNATDPWTTARRTMKRHETLIGLPEGLQRDLYMDAEKRAA